MEVPAIVTENTYRRGGIGIGELSRRTGVPVRTLRFYCDEGILESWRSSGGHRQFDPVSAPDRVRSIRRLRALGLGLSVITEILAGTLSVTDAVTAEWVSLDAELDALTWRRAALLALESAEEDERNARLALLTVIQDRHGAYDGLVALWRRLLAPMPPAMFDGFVEMNIPAPPTDPTVRQILAYAELATAVTDPAFAHAISRQLWRTDGTVRDRRELIEGVAEACEVVGPLVLARVEPRPGPELDRFLAAHTAANGERDTPCFRRRLLEAADDSDPRIQRYWALTSVFTGTTTAGAAQHWLYRALARSAVSHG